MWRIYNKNKQIGNKDYTIEINRAKFEELIEKNKYWTKIENILKKTLDNSNLNNDDIKAIIFVGD